MGVLFRDAIYCLVTDQAGDPVNKPSICDHPLNSCVETGHTRFRSRFEVKADIDRSS